jgi:hypothetical protein
VSHGAGGCTSRGTAKTGARQGRATREASSHAAATRWRRLSHWHSSAQSPQRHHVDDAAMLSAMLPRRAIRLTDDSALVGSQPKGGIGRDIRADTRGAQGGKGLGGAVCFPFGPWAMHVMCGSVGAARRRPRADRRPPSATARGCQTPAEGSIPWLQDGQDAATRASADPLLEDHAASIAPSIQDRLWQSARHLVFVQTQP